MATKDITNEEIIQRAQELLEEGASKMKIETELQLTETQAYRLTTKLKVEMLLKEDPSMLSHVRSLMEHGHSKFHIHTYTGYAMDVVEHLMSKVWDQITDEESKLDDDSIRGLQEQRAAVQLERTKNLEIVSRLMSEGMGRVRIERETGFPRGVIESLQKEVRASEFQTSRPMAKAEKIQTINRILDDGGSAFNVARALELAPGNAQKLVRRVKGQSSLSDDSLRHQMAKGCTLIQLINRFGIKDATQARELFTEIFPEHLIYEKELPDDDIRFTVIPDGTGHFNWLDSNKFEKDFKYKVGDKNNYMFIQFQPNIAGTIRIYNFTDVHVGHKHFDRERFQGYVDMVLADPNAYVVLGGDIIEWAHKFSVGDPAEQSLSPMEQVSEAARLLMPISHKILAYRSGNHDKGRGKMTSTDLAEVLAHYLKVPYFKVETVIDIQLGQELFTVSLDHGHSGGAIQSILKDAEKFREYSPFFVHAHFSGHVHNSQIIERILKDRIIGVGYEFRRSFTVIGGSCVNYTLTYAEEAKYAPTPQDLTYFEMSSSGEYQAGRIRSNGN